MIVPANPIQIKKPNAFKRRFLFYQNDEQIAALNFENSFCYRATAAFGQWNWKFKKRGFFKQYVEVTDQQTFDSKSLIKSGWNNKLTFTTKERNSWLLKPKDFCQTKWGWFNDNNQLMIEFKSNQLSAANRGRVFLNQNINKEIFQLVLMGWYHIITCEDAASAAVSVVIATAGVS